MYLSHRCSDCPKNVSWCYSKVTQSPAGVSGLFASSVDWDKQGAEGCVVMMQFKLCSKQLMSNYNLNIYAVLWFELQNDPFRDDLRPNTTVVLKVSAPAKGRASACYCVLALGCCSKSTSFVLCLEDCLLSFGPCWMLVVGTSLKPLQLQMR